MLVWQAPWCFNCNKPGKIASIIENMTKPVYALWTLTACRPRGYKTWVQSQTQNKAQWLAACGHVSASSQSLYFILSLRMNSSFITSRPGLSVLGAKKLTLNLLKLWTFLSNCSQIMIVIRAVIHKFIVRIANSEDPDQTASSEVWSGSVLFV